MGITNNMVAVLTTWKW